MDNKEKIKKEIYFLKYRKSFMILVGLNIIALIIFGLGIYFITTKEGRIEILSQDVEEIAIKEQKIRIMKKELNRTIVEREKIENLFISSDDIASLLQEIEGLGKDSGVAISFETVSIDNNLDNKLRLNILAQGSFEDIFYLLLLIEQLPIKLLFENITIVKNESKEKEETYAGWEGFFNVSVLSYINE